MNLSILFFVIFLCGTVCGYGHKIRGKRSVHHEELPNSAFDYDKFNTMEAIYEEVFRLHNERPSMVTLMEIGRTYENRPIQVVKISGDRRRDNEVVPMWIDGGIHAREWTAVSSTMYLIKELYNGYDNDGFLHFLMNRIDFYILPVTNPDGYAYTHTTNRNWRKNRRNLPCHFANGTEVCCDGVDLNRNFDAAFGTTGVSNDTCDGNYPGEDSFSELETLAVKRFLEEYRPKAAINVHCCAQQIDPPFQYKNNTYSPDFADEIRVARLAAKMMEKVNGTRYPTGLGSHLMYLASGMMHDWMKGALRIPYVLLVELRLTSCKEDGTYFIFPEDEIKPISMELLEAVKTVGMEIVARFT